MTTVRATSERGRARTRRIVAFSLALTCVLGCRATNDAPLPSRPSHPVVLIGIDGLEWGTVLQMARNGRLPALTGLMRKGSFGTLEVTKPTLSPILWTSIATGTNSNKHGILGFVHGEQKSGVGRGRVARLYTSNDRRVKAFWNILSDASRRVHTIGWWLTYPVENVNGVMVAQVNTVTPQMRRAGKGIWKGQVLEGLQGQVFPPEREPAILAMVPRVEASLPTIVRAVFGTPPPQAPRAPAEMLEQSLWAFRADALYHRVALDVLRNDGPFDLFAVYFGGADVVGHRFWRYAYPELYRHPPGDAEKRAFGHVLEAYYEYLDGMIASLLAAAPPDADVLIVSDHGMEPVRRNGRFRTPALSGGHLSGPPAVLIAAGPDIRAGGRDPSSVQPADLGQIGSILDVTPTVLALLGIPIGRDMDGDALRQLLTEELLERQPVHYVSANTEPGWFARRTKTMLANDDAAERIEQLRALGYLTE
jgi:hypothetical protein